MRFIDRADVKRWIALADSNSDFSTIADGLKALQEVADKDGAAVKADLDSIASALCALMLCAEHMAELLEPGADWNEEFEYEGLANA